MERQRTIILVGAGRMGGAMLRGWLRGLGAGHHFVVVDPHASLDLEELSRDLSERCTIEHVAAVETLPDDLVADAILLATKPGMVIEATRSLEHQIRPQTLIVSIAAGVGASSIQQAVACNPSVVRAMPNIGATLGCSVTAAFASSGVSAEQKALAEALFRSVGTFTWVENEDDLHLVTALSGSGPAYYFAFCEAMIAAARAEGLSAAVAEALAIGTVVSAGRLLEDKPDPTLLRETVTSPNGTTAAGLAALGDEDALNVLARKAVAEARRRSIELS